MVLELARLGAVDRPVGRVVDARRELVGQQAPPDVEQLDREDADVAELVEQQRADPLGLCLGRPGGRRPRDAQDPVAVDVLCDRPESRLAVSCPHADDRELAVEGDELLGQLVVPDRPVPLEQTLALPVVAEPARLDERREPRVVERAESCSRDPERAEELLLAQPVLPQLERAGRGTAPMRAAASTGTFSNSYVTTSAPSASRSSAAASSYGADDELADLARACVGRGVEEAKAKDPSGSPGEPEHAPELPAADAGDERHLGAVDSPRAFRPPDRGCRARPASGRRGSAAAARRAPSSEPARIAAASRAALTAPARPIASVPTGIPAGIWTIESSESMPESAFDSTGTPSTGSVVFDAAIPGRCAAPPAPGDQHFQARAPPPTPRTRTAGRASGAPRRRAARTVRRARRASRRRAASSPSRSASP